MPSTARGSTPRCHGTSRGIRDTAGTRQIFLLWPIGLLVFVTLPWSATGESGKHFALKALLVLFLVLFVGIVQSFDSKKLNDNLQKCSGGPENYCKDEATARECKKLHQCGGIYENM